MFEQHPHKRQVEDALSRAEGALGLLASEERRDVERLLQFLRSFFGEDAPEKDEEAQRVVRRETARLVEILARRSAHAMPFAALGRALLAFLAGSGADGEALLREFEFKLSLLGL